MSCVATCFLVLGASSFLSAQEYFGAFKQPERESLTLEVGKSQILEIPVQIKRTSIANPAIADTLVLSPTQLYLVGKAVGETNITVWDHEGKGLKTYDLLVIPGLSALKKQFHELLHEENIQVHAQQDYISLSGTVSSATNLTQALTLAETYAPKKVINLLQVGGEQQVMLDVRVAEMSRSLGRRLGINLNVFSGNDFGVTTIKGLAVPQFQDGAIDNIRFSSAVTAIAQIVGGPTTFLAFIDALKEQGLVKILAKPNLLTVSGREASFLAGGEFPFPVPQAFGVITIQFKKFGVGLLFKPVVLSPNRISMEVSPEVSELDFTRGISITGGITIPAITTRRASTMIELSDGQSFAIAGLIQDNVRENVAKFPILGDLPVLGPLFRSSEFQKNETELVIIVTPHFVKPLNMAKQTLPTDSFVEPSDYAFYIEGRVDGRLPSGNLTPSMSSLVPVVNAASRLDGKFGHRLSLE